MMLGLQLPGIKGAIQAHFGGEDLLAPPGLPESRAGEWHHGHLTLEAATASTDVPVPSARDHQ
jgi:hypothetical protein